MAPRAVWKGFLKLAGVSCAVKLTGATSEAGKVHFRTLSRKTRTPVQAIYMDEDTGKPVERDDQAKGYELEGGEFALIDPEEIRELDAEAEHVLEIAQFVNPVDVPSLYREKPYYLYPADDGAAEAFGVIRKAMEKSNSAGLADIVLYRRERPVLLEPLGNGLLATTLRYENWMVDTKDAFDGLKRHKVDAEMAEIASLIIEKKTGKFEPESFEDTYENALLELIKAKQKGDKPPKPAARPRKNVVNLSDLLRKSLEKEGGTAKKPARKSRKTAKKKSTRAA